MNKTYVVLIVLLGVLLIIGGIQAIQISSLNTVQEGVTGASVVPASAGNRPPAPAALPSMVGGC